MKIKRSMASFCLLLFLLVPLGVLANQLPFLPIYEGPMTKEIAQKRFLEMKALPKTDKRRIEFFRRSAENTGYSEKELTIIVARGAIKVEECGTCDEMTYAMYPNGTSAINRPITPTELRTLITVDANHSIPWFVIRCVNPLKKNEPPPPPQKPVAVPVPEVISGCNTECWQSGPTMISYPFAGMNGNSIIVNGGYGYFGAYTSPGVYSGIVFHTPITCGDVPYNTFKTPEVKK